MRRIFIFIPKRRLDSKEINMNAPLQVKDPQSQLNWAIVVLQIFTHDLSPCTLVNLQTIITTSTNPDQVLLFPLIRQFDLPINDPISTSTRTSRFDRRSMSTDTVLSYYFGNTYLHTNHITYNLNAIIYLPIQK